MLDRNNVEVVSQRQLADRLITDYKLTASIVTDGGDKYGYTFDVTGYTDADGREVYDLYDPLCENPRWYGLAYRVDEDTLYATVHAFLTGFEHVTSISQDNIARALAYREEMARKALDDPREYETLRGIENVLEILGVKFMV